MKSIRSSVRPSLLIAIAAESENVHSCSPCMSTATHLFATTMKFADRMRALCVRCICVSIFDLRVCNRGNECFSARIICSSFVREIALKRAVAIWARKLFLPVVAFPSVRPQRIRNNFSASIEAKWINFLCNWISLFFFAIEFSVLHDIRIEISALSLLTNWYWNW